MKNKRRKNALGLYSFTTVKMFGSSFIYLLSPMGQRISLYGILVQLKAKKKIKKIEGLCLGAGKIKNF